MEKQKIAVVGSYAVGMTIYGDHFPTPGETVPGYNFFSCHGGKGSNQAVAAARMGAKVVYGTCIGKDGFGEGALKLFKEEDIDYEAVRISETSATGVGLIMINKEGENEIVTDFAANREFGPADIDAMFPKIKECKLLLMQFEGSIEAVERAAKLCKENDIAFVLNPAPFAPCSEEVLKCCTYITPNQTEARQLLGLDGNDPRSDKEVAHMLREKGINNIVMTLGSEGCYILNDELDIHVPGMRVDPVDTVGAGDTFTGAFCAALAEGKSVVEAAKMGNVAAGIAVTRVGVVESIPSRAEVDKKLEEMEA